MPPARTCRSPTAPASPRTCWREGARFPVITALEVIEHVPDPAAFLATLAALLAPGGKLFLSTLNRTPQSFLAAKVGAEYLLRWLPVGTHDWRRFITPAELGAMLRRCRTAGDRHHRPGGRPADRALDHQPQSLGELSCRRRRLDYPSARGTQGIRETSMPSSASASACSGLVSP